MHSWIRRQQLSLSLQADHQQACCSGRGKDAASRQTWKSTSPKLLCPHNYLNVSVPDSNPTLPFLLVTGPNPWEPIKDPLSKWNDGVESLTVSPGPYPALTCGGQSNQMAEHWERGLSAERTKRQFHNFWWWTTEGKRTQSERIGPWNSSTYWGNNCYCCPCPRWCCAQSHGSAQPQPARRSTCKWGLIWEKRKTTWNFWGMEASLTSPALLLAIVFKQMVNTSPISSFLNR